MSPRYIKFSLWIPIFALAACHAPSSDSQGASVSTPAVASLPPVASVAAEGLLPNELRPTSDLLVGGQPTAEQSERIAESGFRTVINLRMPDEKGNDLGPDEWKALGLQYFSLPVNGRSGPTEEQAQELSSILSQEGALPAVVHCAAGGRVGALFALEAFYVDGATGEQALDVGRNAGMAYMEPKVRKILGETAAEENEGS